MELKWLIIALVVMSLVGSIAWALPTPVQRAQGKMRALAMQKGMRVNISKLQMPRERGHVEAASRLATSYTLYREASQSKILRQQKQPSWQVFKANGTDTQGLPEGWCWPKDRPVLADAQLTLIASVISQLPADVYSLSSCTESVSIYWHEQGVFEDIETIYQALVRLR